MRPLTAATLGKGVVTLAVGALVGAVGTVMHRASPPWGLVGCLALVLTAAVTARAWAGWVTWIAYVGGLFFAVQLMAQAGPGGDVLVPAKSAIGWVWVLGSILVALVAGFLPRRLFTEPPPASDGPPVAAAGVAPLLPVVPGTPVDPGVVVDPAAAAAPGAVDEPGR